MTRSYNGRQQTLSKLFQATIERRTDKAVLVELNYSGSDGEIRGAKVWFPISQIVENEGAIYAADWLLAKKAEDLPLASRCQCRIETVRE